MEARFHLDDVIESNLTKVISQFSELAILSRLWEIDVEVDGTIEKDSFAAYGLSGSLKNFPLSPSLANVKITWRMGDSELPHAIQVMELTSELTRLLIKSVREEKILDKVLDLALVQKLSDNDKDYIKNVHKAYHGRKTYDITDIVNDKATERLSNKFLEKNS